MRRQIFLTTFPATFPPAFRLTGKAPGLAALALAFLIACPSVARAEAKGPSYPPTIFSYAIAENEAEREFSMDSPEYKRAALAGKTHGAFGMADLYYFGEDGRFKWQVVAPRGPYGEGQVVRGQWRVDETGQLCTVVAGSPELCHPLSVFPMNPKDSAGEKLDGIFRTGVVLNNRYKDETHALAVRFPGDLLVRPEFMPALRDGMDRAKALSRELAASDSTDVWFGTPPGPEGKAAYDALAGKIVIHARSVAYPRADGTLEFYEMKHPLAVDLNDPDPSQFYPRQSGRWFIAGDYACSKTPMDFGPGHPGSKMYVFCQLVQRGKTMPVPLDGLVYHTELGFTQFIRSADMLPFETSPLRPLFE